MESSERRLQLIENFSLALNCFSIFYIFFVHLADRLISHFDVRTHTHSYTDTHAQNNGRKRRRNISIFCSFYFGIDLIFSFDGWNDALLKWKPSSGFQKETKKRNYMHSYYSELDTFLFRSRFLVRDNEQRIIRTIKDSNKLDKKTKEAERRRRKKCRAGVGNCFNVVLYLYVVIVSLASFLFSQDKLWNEIKVSNTLYVPLFSDLSGYLCDFTFDDGLLLC